MIRRGQLERGIALEAVRREIAARIAPVCKNFGRDEFTSLVDRMAEIEVRYRLRDDWANYRDVALQQAEQLRQLSSHSSAMN